VHSAAYDEGIVSRVKIMEKVSVIIETLIGFLRTGAV